MLEADYKPIIEAYLARRSTVEGFITDFMYQWKVDRDKTLGQPLREEQPVEARFRDMMNRLFTSCDCYAERPEAAHEIAEHTLRAEVTLFHNIIWMGGKSQNWQESLAYPHK